MKNSILMEKIAQKTQRKKNSNSQENLFLKLILYQNRKEKKEKNYLQIISNKIQIDRKIRIKTK